jgi:periplasmic protein TonB
MLLQATASEADGSAVMTGLRKPHARRAAVALGVLLLHAALVWLLPLSLYVPRTPPDASALQVFIFQDVRPGAAAAPLPQIKPDSRVPEPEVPDSALEIPIVLPVEVTKPDTVSPGLSDTASVSAPQGEDGHQSSQGAAPGPGGAGMSPLREVWPVYPPASIQQAEEGYAVVVLTVDASGQPVNAAVRQGSGFARLDAAALRAARQWRFGRAANPQAQPRQILVWMGFGLSAGPPVAYRWYIHRFDAGSVARINGLARRPAAQQVSGEAMRRLIATLLEQLGSQTPDADTAGVRRVGYVFAVAQGARGAPRLSGRPAWPRQALDASRVLNVRFMGLVDYTEQDFDGVTRPWLTWSVFAVQQEQGTSEWLIATGPGGAISAVDAMSGGPPCSAAPASAACAGSPAEAP